MESIETQGLSEEALIEILPSVEEDLEFQEAVNDITTKARFSLLYLL